MNSDSIDFDFAPDAPISENDFVRADKFEIKPIEWLIEGYMVKRGVAVWFGEPGKGKSFLAQASAYAIATGMDWFGQQVRQGGVVYIMGEGHDTAPPRLAALAEHYGLPLDSLPLFFSIKSFNLNDKKSISELIKVIRSILKKMDVPPVLLIIDTMASNFGDGDENSTKEMNMFINYMNVFASNLDLMVLIVHHSGVAEPNRPRGSGVSTGTCDHTARISASKDGVIEYQGIKNRAITMPPPKYFRIKNIPVMPSNGNIPFLAPVLISADKPEGFGPDLTGRNLEAYIILEQFLADHGTPRRVGPSGAEIATVLWDDLKSSLRQAWADKYDVPASLTKTITRAVKALESCDFIGSIGPYVWIKDKTDN